MKRLACLTFAVVLSCMALSTATPADAQPGCQTVSTNHPQCGVVTACCGSSCATLNTTFCAIKCCTRCANPDSCGI